MSHLAGLRESPVHVPQQPLPAPGRQRASGGQRPERGRGWMWGTLLESRQLVLRNTDFTSSTASPGPRGLIAPSSLRGQPHSPLQQEGAQCPTRGGRSPGERPAGPRPLTLPCPLGSCLVPPHPSSPPFTVTFLIKLCAPRFLTCAWGSPTFRVSATLLSVPLLLIKGWPLCTSAEHTQPRPVVGRHPHPSPLRSCKKICSPLLTPPADSACCSRSRGAGAPCRPLGGGLCTDSGGRGGSPDTPPAQGQGSQGQGPQDEGSREPGGKARPPPSAGGRAREQGLPSRSLRPLRWALGTPGGGGSGRTAHPLEAPTRCAQGSSCTGDASPFWAQRSAHP